MAEDFEAVVLGVGDAFSALHRPSSLLLRAGGFQLGVDCPDSYRAVLRAAEEKGAGRLQLEEVDHFLITHVHGDHLNGLEAVAFFKHFVEGKRVRLLTSPEVLAVLWEGRLQASMGALWDGARLRQMRFEDYFEVLPWSWSEPMAVGPFRITARRTKHHVPTSALLVEAAGRRLGYSADTAFDPSLIAFLEPADLIVHETNLGPAHTPYAELAALPEVLRARLRLIHYPDGLTASAGPLRLLEEGEVLRPQEAGGPRRP